MKKTIFKKPQSIISLVYNRFHRLSSLNFHREPTNIQLKIFSNFYTKLKKKYLKILNIYKTH